MLTFGDRQRPELPPQERLAVEIEAAANQLGFRVPSQEYALQVMDLLTKLQPVTSVRPIVSWQVNRLLRELGVTSLEELEFTGGQDFGGVALWNPDGGSLSGGVPIPHTLSFVSTDINSGRTTSGENWVPAREYRIATVPVGTTALTFPDYTRTIGLSELARGGQIFLASTVTPR